MLKLIELFETQHEKIPVSRAALDDELPLWKYFEAVAAQIKDADVKERTIDVRGLVNGGKLFSTQSSTAADDAQDDPVFPRLGLPVIFEDHGAGYILDGHHRLESAFESGAKIKVYWF